MEQKVLKALSVFLTFFTIGAICLINYLPDLHTSIVAKEEKEKARMEMSGLEMLHYYTTKAKVDGTDDISFKQQLRIQLPDGVTEKDVTVTDSYLTQEIEIVIPNTDEDYFYDYPVLGTSEDMDALTYGEENGTSTILIQMDGVMEVETDYEDEYLYLDFLTPHERYDKVVVIDAGHGGDTPGITSGDYSEKDINLAIVTKLKALFDAQEEVGVYYTRMDDTDPSSVERTSLANKSDADLLISVHCNAMSDEKFSYIHGTEVMYNVQETDGKSQNLAQICLEEMVSAIGSVNKGLMNGKDVYILQNAQVPAALIEIGFMTNPDELALLTSEDYQNQAAQGIYNAVMRALDEGY